MKTWKFLFWIFAFLFSGFYAYEAVSKDDKGISNEISSQEIQKISKFIQNSDYQQDFVFLIDFKKPSNTYRFYIYDLKKSKTLEKGMVSHGTGSQVKGSSNLKFSNIEGSYQSSLGKYEIAEKYSGQFGKSYRLKGLDASNSKAMERAIVLHSLDCVPDSELKTPLCLSLGCPMVSPKFLDIIESYIEKSKKPVILYAFY